MNVTSESYKSKSSSVVSISNSSYILYLSLNPIPTVLTVVNNHI